MTDSLVDGRVRHTGGDPELPTSVTQASATRRAYAGDWARFQRWCETRGHRSLPADVTVVAHYLGSVGAGRHTGGQGTYAPATLARWTAAIAERHNAHGFESPSSNPVVREALSQHRIAHANRVSTPRSAVPLLTAEIVALVTEARRQTTNWASELYERRDCALLLLGFAGAMRRDELVNLLCGEVTLLSYGDVRLYGRSRGDTGHTRIVPGGASPHQCPPCAVARWLRVISAFDTGGRPAVIRLLKTEPAFDQHVCTGPTPRTRVGAPVFRSIRRNGNLSPTGLSGSAMHRAIRHRAELAGYGPDVSQRVGVHSLRAGFITQALINGADPRAVARHTGHFDTATLHAYLRRSLPPADDPQPIEIGL